MTQDFIVLWLAIELVLFLNLDLRYSILLRYWISCFFSVLHILIGNNHHCTHPSFREYFQVGQKMTLSEWNYRATVASQILLFSFFMVGKGIIKYERISLNFLRQKINAHYIQDGTMSKQPFCLSEIVWGFQFSMNMHVERSPFWKTKDWV